MPTDRDPITRGAVLIEGSRITAVGAESQVRAPRGATVLDADGGTVIPGMINLHDHTARKSLRAPSTTRQSRPTAGAECRAALEE